MRIHQLIILALIVSVVSSISTMIIASNLQNTSKEDFIKNFYLTENYVHVSPHSLRKLMDGGDRHSFILVDLRSKEEYEKEHIIGAINIPAYKDPSTSA